MRRPGPPFRSRTGVFAVVVATLGVAACDTGGSFRPNERLWGFVNIGALRTAGGEHRTAPTAVFLRGEITSIPNAALRPDSCFPSATYVPPTNTFSGVTYIDAGSSVTMAIGGVQSEFPRVSASGAISYGLGSGSTVAYTPGDSVVISVPGVDGGYPALTARGKTAEAFTFEPIQGTPGATIPIRWTAAQDNNSALIVSLQFTPSGSGRREIRCAFVDDGVDSIPARFHDEWSNAANLSREVVVTRLRTLIATVGNGAFELISTYQVPTPTP